jgi:hypothetical protein
MSGVLSAQPQFIPDMRERFVLFAALAYIAMTLLAGPARMYLSLAGVAPLIYIPNLLIMLAIAWQFFAGSHTHGFSPLSLIALLLPIYAAVIGMQFVSPLQTAMGVYVLMPFWFGLCCGPLLIRHWHLAGRAVPFLWAIAVAGILANLYIEYPWEGFEYELGDLDVEGSREWYAAGGVKRLAGFARASFDAAVHVQLLGILLTLQVRSPLMRILVWAITIAAIVPTTSKGMLLVTMVLTPVVLLRNALPESPLRALPALFGMIGLALPTATLLFTFNSEFSNRTLANATFSFYDRLNYMWPEAWELIRQHGNLLLGRGIGGIGTAQTYFEESLFNAGDNIFMYWFVVFGWAALPGFALLILKTLKLRPHGSDEQMRIFCLLLATIVYGTMTNIVENAVFAIVCGTLVRWLCSTPQQSALRSDDPPFAANPLQIL